MIRTDLEMFSSIIGYTNPFVISTESYYLVLLKKIKNYPPNKLILFFSGLNQIHVIQTNMKNMKPAWLHLISAKYTPISQMDP